jgi:hypothetical protein
LKGNWNKSRFYLDENIKAAKGKHPLSFLEKNLTLILTRWHGLSCYS